MIGFTPNANAKVDEGGNQDYVMQEWQAAQNDLLKFDDYLHDIRKYGFSFVTGLLTVDVLFGQEDSKFKLAALLGTMALIVVLFVIDRNYRVFNAAANIRATLLERRCPMELSQTITRLYESQRVGMAFTFVYFGLVLVTALIGFLVVDPALIWVLVSAVVVSFITMAALHFTLGIRPWVYVDIDGFTYKKDEPILVVVSHLRGKGKSLVSRIRQMPAPPIKLKAGERVWDVYREEDTLMERPEAVNPEWARDPSKDPRIPKEELQIRERFEHRWEIPAGFLDHGLYRVVYHGPIYRRVGILRYDLFPKPGQPVSPQELKDRWDGSPRFHVVS